MRKCVFLVAAFAALVTAASAACADLIDFSLVPDGVYTSQSAYQDWLSNQTSTDILPGATITGQTVNLANGVTSAYVSMAIVATINNPNSSTPISSDGIAWACLNIVGTTSGNMGTGVLENPTGAAALVNDGNLVGNVNGNDANNNANPGANNGSYGAGTQYWQTLAASPVQAYAGTSTKSSSSGYYKKAIEWPENFTATGAQAGVNTAPMTIGVAGSAAETTSDLASNFTAIYSPPTVPANARLVTYSSPTSYTVSSASTGNGTAIQPSSYLQGASGINANTATFILGEVDYTFSGASNGGTATINATPANLSAIIGGCNTNFLVNGVEVQSAYLTATSGTTGVVVGSGPPVKISVGPFTYWNGAGLTTALSNSANWTYGLPPIGTELDFGPSASGGSTFPNNDTFTSAAGIRFLGASDSAWGGVNSGAYTLTGLPLTLTGPINNDSTNNQLVNLNITLATGAGTISTVTNSVTVNGVISSSGAIGLTKMGTGSLILAGSNTYIGGTTVSAGVLQLGVQAGVPDNTVLTISGGTLDLGSFTKTTIAAVSFQGGVTQDGTIINNGAAYGGQAGTVSACLQGAAGLSKTTGGTLVLSGSNGYTGITAINGGILNIGAADANTASTLGTGPLGSVPLNTPNTISFGGGTLQYSSANNTDYSGRFSTAANQPISIDTNGQTVTFGTALTSVGGSLTLNDSDLASPGKLILTGANTYSGGTTVSAGVLQLSAAGGLFDQWSADRQRRHAGPRHIQRDNLRRSLLPGRRDARRHDHQ